jgi:hypothetical protein
VLNILLKNVTRDDVNEKLVCFLSKSVKEVFQKKPWRLNKREKGVYAKIGKKFNLNVSEVINVYFLVLTCTYY